MKKFLTILLIVLCHIVLQHHTGILKLADHGIAYADSETPAIPEACKESEKEFENVCYGASNVTYTEQVNALRNIKSCLKKEGFTDGKIKKTLILIKQKASEKADRKLTKK